MISSRLPRTYHGYLNQNPIRDILEIIISILNRLLKDKIVLKMILQPIVRMPVPRYQIRGGGTITVRGYEDRNGIVWWRTTGSGWTDRRSTVCGKAEGNRNMEVKKKEASV